MALPIPDAQGSYHILYPQRMRVNGATLRIWAQDETGDEYATDEAAIEFLDDAGLVTFARR
jgi:hypothetical protein